jgi:DNA repair protein RadC
MKDLNEYSNKELLQVVLGDRAGHLSETILTYKEGGIRTLNTFNEPFLAHIGVSQGRRERLLCAIELGRRIQAAEMQNVLKVKNSASVFEYCKSKLSGLAHEEFHVLLLNRSNRLVKEYQVSKGGISGTVVDIRMILKEALFVGAACMILVHNHPSGNKQPSQADITLTKQIQEAAKFMDISVLDHIIIADQSYYSFADDGII